MERSDPVCPRCGMGKDTDGDGDCPLCANFTVEQLERINEAKGQSDKLYDAIKRYPILDFFACGC